MRKRLPRKRRVFRRKIRRVCAGSFFVRGRSPSSAFFLVSCGALSHGAFRPLHCRLRCGGASPRIRTRPGAIRHVFPGRVSSRRYRGRHQENRSSGIGERSRGRMGGVRRAFSARPSGNRTLAWNREWSDCNVRFSRSCVFAAACGFLRHCPIEMPGNIPAPPSSRGARLFHGRHRVHRSLAYRDGVSLRFARGYPRRYPAGERSSRRARACFARGFRTCPFLRQVPCRKRGLRLCGRRRGRHRRNAAVPAVFRLRSGSRRRARPSLVRRARHKRAPEVVSSRCVLSQRIVSFVRGIRLAFCCRFSSMLLISLHRRMRESPKRRCVSGFPGQRILRDARFCLG